MSDRPLDGSNVKTKIDVNDTPKMNYTGTDNNDQTRVDAPRRSTMIGVNLFGGKSSDKPKPVEKEEK